MSGNLRTMKLIKQPIRQMKVTGSISVRSNALFFTVALLIVTFSMSEFSIADNAVFIHVDTITVHAAAPAAPVVQPPAGAEEAKPDKKETTQKANAKPLRLAQPILYPTLYPNPLAFNITWVTVTNKTFADVRALANRQMAAARHAALVRRPPANAAVQNAVQQQTRKLLEPMLKVELSFAARATDLNRVERQKLTAEAKKWFEEFLVDFLKKQDPNQQQMLLQGMQGVWFGNQQQKPSNPRDAIQAGVAKLVKDSLSKKKVAAYENECRKRNEFARQVSVDNMVERLDEKVKLSPDQWKKITKSLNDHWDKNRDPQLEAFALNPSMWPGVPDECVLPELSPAQQAVLKRINTNSEQIFFNGGVFGQMFGGDNSVIDDVDLETVQPATDAAPAVESGE
jgi:hypothetical protein